MTDSTTHPDPDDRRRHVASGIRDAIWQMRDGDDLGQVLAAIRQGLASLDVPAEAWGVNVVNDRNGRATVDVHSMDSTGRWVRLQPESTDTVVGFWRAGRVAYRPDVRNDDPYDEARHFYRMRAVVDVPFAHGTLAVSSSVPGVFTDAHIGVLQDMAQLLEDGFRRTAELRSLEARHRLREEVWKMQGRGDVQRLVTRLRAVLDDLGFDYHTCGINLIEPRTGQSGATVRSHDLTNGGEWKQHDLKEAPSLLERLWRAGRTAYREDLEQADVHGELANLRRAHGDGVRCVVDVPFQFGTLALNSTRPRAFSARQIVVLEDLAMEMEEGFRRLQDLEALEERNRALRIEVDERLRAEASLSQALDEKVVLLKEIHHRVKNNLQIVSSLLNLQASGATDPQLVARLDESRARIESMALIHEQLYGSEDLAHIDCAEYVAHLTRNLFDSMGIDDDRVHLRVEVESVDIDVDRAVCCGLIVNELVSNALKHAFPGDRAGTIRVTLGRHGAGGIFLAVADDGAGLPPDVDIGQSGSLGLTLIEDFVAQLHGDVVLRREAGTNFEIRFPL